MEEKVSAAERLIREVNQLRDKPLSVQAAVRTEELLSSLVQNVSTVIKSASYLEQLELVRHISKKFVEVRDLDTLAKDILNGANELIPFTDGSIGLFYEGVIRFPYAIGKNKDSVMHYETPIGKGLTGWVVLHQESLNIGDVRNDPRYDDQINDTNSELDVPIVYGNESLGLINIESNKFGAFTVEDQYLLETLADAAAIAIKNVQFIEQIEARTRIIERLTSTLVYVEVISLILEVIFELVQCTEASVGVVDDTRREVHFTYANGPSKNEVEKFNISIDKGLTGWAVRNNKSVRVDDVTKDDRYESQISKTRSELDIPLVFTGKVVGVLNLESPNLSAFTKGDQSVLEDIAPYIALALTNAGIYDHVKKELSLQQQLRGYAESRAVIGDVTGNIVHDVNGTVGLIRIEATEFKEIAQDRKLVESADKILEYTERVFNQIREFQERRDSYFVQPGPLDINGIIHKALSEAEIPSNIKILLKLREDLPTSFAAPEQLKKVLLSLINNAITAMPDGGGIWMESGQQGTSILVRIKDSGIGIQNEDQKKIFEENFTKNRYRRGTGFGLYWSRLYIKGIQGELYLESSEVGKGSVFVVELPMYREDI